MEQRYYIRVLTTSLAIFAMLFGAGNLMFPLRIGMQAGEATFLGFLGFALSGVLLPACGLVAIVAFNGSYYDFFGRLGSVPRDIIVFCCMLVIGPLIAMPRIMMLSYEMLRPFLIHIFPACIVSEINFAVVFAFLIFLATYRPGKLLTIIGRILSPLKVLSVVTIVAAGVFSGTSPVSTDRSSWNVFIDAFNDGYVTLDVLGAIFFGSMVVTLLTAYVPKGHRLSTKEAVKVAGSASIFASILLGLVYLGMTYLGAFHGHGLEHLNDGQVFSQISFRVLGDRGAALIGLTVFLACFTTIVTLTAVLSEYIQNTLSRRRVTYPQAALIVLILSILVASAGLGAIISYSKPFISFFYPILIVITLCNLLYAVANVQLLWTPVIVTTIFVCIKTFYPSIMPFIGV